MKTIEKRMLRLPSVYRKDAAGNVYRLLLLDALEADSLEETLSQINQWRDIDSAQGTTLDRIGVDLGLPRGNLEDVDYRTALKTQIAINLSGGEVERFNAVLPQVMGDAYLGTRDADEPAQIIITYDQERLYAEVADRYGGVGAGRVRYLDGSFLLMGEYPLDAGVAELGHTVNDILATVAATQSVAHKLKAAGVGVWWEAFSDQFTEVEVGLGAGCGIGATTTVLINFGHTHAVNVAAELQLGPRVPFVLDGVHLFSGDERFGGDRPWIAHRLQTVTVES